MSLADCMYLKSCEISSLETRSRVYIILIPGWDVYKKTALCSVLGWNEIQHATTTAFLKSTTGFSMVSGRLTEIL